MTRVILLLPAVMILSALAAPHPAQPPDSSTSDEDDAATAKVVRAVMEAGIGEALAVLRDEELTLAERTRGFREVLSDRIDFGVVSRLALGPAWRDLTGSQREEFVTEFTAHILAIGTQAVEQYDGEEVNITTGRKEPRGDWTVRTRIIREKEDRAPRDIAGVDFRMRKRGDKWRIIDVRIEGVSMVAGFRAQFEALMLRGGIERVLELLRERNRERENAREQRENDSSM